LHYSPLKIATIYALTGAFWILFSDWLLHLFVTDPVLVARLSTFKGWAFIAVTALVLYRLIVVDHRKIRRSGEAVREREELLRNVLETLPLGVWLLDRDGTITYGNRAGREIWGGNLLVGIDNFHEYKGWWLETGKRIRGEEWGGVRAIREGKVSLAEEIEIATFDGTKKIILHSAVPLRDQQGAIEGAIVVNEDITARKQMEKSLREQEKIYRELFENNPQPMWIYEVKTLKFLAVNDAAVEHYGYSRQEFLQMTLKDIRPEGDVPALISAVGTGRGRLTKAGVWQHHKKDATTIHVDLTTHDLLFNGSYARLVLINDVSGRLRVELENAAYQDRLRNLASEMSLVEERERRQLATSLHDQIGQVLALAKIRLGGMNTSVSSAESRQLAVELRELLDQAITSARSLTFELSPPILYELGFETALQALCENFQKQHGLSLEFSSDREPKPLSDDMKILLFRAVRELLVNAVKHARAGKIRVSCRRDHSRLLIVVVDDGIGFDSAASVANSPDGPGFGLFSIRERLHYLGGEITLESSPGRGTSVTLAVNLQEASRGVSI